MAIRINSVLFLLLVAICSTNAAITNIPPPFSTNAPGEYLLEHPWLGESRVVVRTGTFTNWTNQPQIEKFDAELRFDVFIVRDKSSAHQPGSLVIAESAGRPTNAPFSYAKPHVYRSSLPSTAEIQACSTGPKLTELLGPPHDIDGPPYMAFWHFFTFSSATTIEALSVDATTEQAGHIDSLLVRRGTIKRSD